MFINQLTDVQLTAFARDLTRTITELDDRDWNIYIRQKKDVARISLSVTNDSRYNMEMNLFNFDLSIFNSGMFLNTFITKKFFQFMYRTFGEEYKTAYLENAAQVFEDDK